MNNKYYYIVFFTLLSFVSIGQKSDGSKLCIAVTGRPSSDSITLRWAPLNFKKWEEGNRNGYIIERFTLVKDSRVLAGPERKILGVNPIKPLPLEAWEPLVKRNRYAAITAQSLYGASFLVEMGKQSDVLHIVNKARENDQRFQFALFSADMSVPVARASGLLYTDKDVNANEKYLYKISISGSTDSCSTSLFIGSKDVYELPPIAHVGAERQGALVQLQWQKDKANLYTAYEIERSVNGKDYSRISDEPVTMLTPTEEESSSVIYASDSLMAIPARLWYRVVGITPFGERGPVHESVEARTKDILDFMPHITKGYSENNKEINLQWELPERMEGKVKGFHIDRSSIPGGKYKRITPQLVPADSRIFIDLKPEQINYYKVAAVSPGGEELASPLFLVQLVDSIPPLPPANLSAVVDDFGNIALKWNANAETDMYGYRVYRANYKGEELSLLTGEPIPTSVYADKVNLKFLNRHVYYKVMAIDRNQNQSALSEMLEVKLPDKMKPMPPVFLPVNSSNDGVILRWQGSSSDDVVAYDVYRQGVGEKQWMRISNIPSGKDSVYSYRDSNLSLASYRYTVIAVDQSGLESEPSQAVVGNNIDNRLRPPVTLREPVVDREKNSILISWAYMQARVQSYKIFRSVDTEPSILYKTLPGTVTEFSDKELRAGKEYHYRVLVVFDNQKKSELSKVLKVTF